MHTSRHHPEPTGNRQAAWVLTSLGILHIPLVGFHLAIPSLFGWSEELPRLTPENAGLMICLHACGIFWLASMGATTLVEGIRGLKGRPAAMPRGFWLWMAGFYLFIFSAEIALFEITPVGMTIMILLGAMAGAYSAAWSKLDPTPPMAAHLGLRLRPGSMLR